MNDELRPVRVSVDRAAKMLGLGRSYAWQLVQRGDLRSHKDGKHRFVLVTDIEAYAARCAEGGRELAGAL